MSKRYVIDLPDDAQYILINGASENHCHTRVEQVDDLEELNSDYINEHYGELQDEAYQRGHDDGYEAGCATAFKPVSDTEYQSGLDDAMNAFKKLYSCGWERDWKAMGFEFDEGEWSRSFEFIIGHYTAAEIVEKVKAYEESKNKIRVGDVVYFNGKPEVKACVTAINESGMETTFCGIAITNVETYCSVGNPYSFCRMDDWHKTGEHFDIEQLWKGES